MYNIQIKHRLSLYQVQQYMSCSSGLVAFSHKRGPKTYLTLSNFSGLCTTTLYCGTKYNDWLQTSYKDCLVPIWSIVTFLSMYIWPNSSTKAYIVLIHLHSPQSPIICRVCLHHDQTCIVAQILDISTNKNTSWWHHQWPMTNDIM